MDDHITDAMAYAMTGLARNAMSRIVIESALDCGETVFLPSSKSPYGGCEVVPIYRDWEVL